MTLEFKTKKLKSECEDFRKATKSYGDRDAKKLHQRVQELKTFESLDEMVALSIGRCHPLKGNYKGKYALDLVHPNRLIVEPVVNDQNEITGVKIVKLLEVIDYHGN